MINIHGGKDGFNMDSSINQYWDQTLSMIRTSQYFDESTLTWISKTSLFKIENGKAYLTYRNIIASNLIKDNLCAV